MANPLEMAGSRSTKKTRFAPIFINRPYGLYTNRNPLRDPSDTAFEKFYGGRPGALIGGQNVELTNKLTLARRAGVSQFSAVTYPDVPDTFYSFRKQDGTIKVIVDTTGFVYADNQDGTKTLILTKTAGAGQSYFQGVGNTLYFGDGIDLKKWDGTNTWNWGSTAPLAAPSVTITPSGESAVLWQANTVYSTMGLLVDANGNVQQMTSVNATGTNTTRYGTTGNGQPAWNAAGGGTTTDNTVTWKNFGPVGLWTPNTLYNNAYGGASGGTLANPCIIYDPATDATYININGGGAGGTGTSTSTRPPFTGVNGSIVYETNNAIKWFCIKPKPGLWQPSHVYAGYGAGGAGVNQSIVEPIALSATYNPAVQPTIFQIAFAGGTSGTGGTSPVWGTTAGAPTPDGDLIWVCQGSATWAALTSYTGWGGSGQLLFSVIKDQNGNFQVSVQAGSGVSGATVPMAQWKAATAYAVNAVVADSNGFQQKVTSVSGTGTSGAAAPAWNQTVGGTTTDNPGANQVVWTNQGLAGTGGRPPGWGINYGDQTNDGTAKWACVGPTMLWAASTVWYFPITNFSPPQPSSPYGGPDIKDTNSNVQFVIASGKSQTPGPPAWATIGAKTVDGAATWYCASAFSANSLSWTKGYGYVTAYKARPANDIYNTTAPPGLRAPLGPPTGSQSGLVTTASLPFIMATGTNAGSVNTITGVGSTDPQIDTVVIFRSTDGFQNGGPYLFLTEIPNPPVLNGAAGAWSYKDYQPDTALNPLIAAPVNGANNPPPAGAINAVLHFGRIWVSVGSVVYCSGGPDTTTGNGSEAFPQRNAFVFPSNVTRLVPTSVGLLVFTTSDIYGIFGGPSVLTFYPQPLVPGVGLLSWNALDQEGGLIYIFSADGQFLALDPSLGVTRSGFPIADQIASWNPSNVYVTCHESGNDNAIYLADGSTGWYRMNPTQAPDGGAVWSPKANITGGCKVVQSIEVTKGVHQLLIGSTTGGQTISKRDLTVFTDKGTPYQADFTIGSLVLAHPGQLAELNFITADFTRVGTSPAILFLLNEISGAFTAFGTPIPDPPSLYGTTGQPLTLFANRYYFSPTQVSAWCRHLQIRVNFGATDVVPNELLSLTVFAAHFQEL